MTLETVPAFEAEPAVTADGTAGQRPARRPPNRGRKGGRLKQMSLRLSPEEHALFSARAADAGLSGASYLRACALGDAGPRARRGVSVDLQLLAVAVANLNKVGSNVNQIARALNLGQHAYEAFSLDTLAEVRQAVAEIRQAFGRQDRS